MTTKYTPGPWGIQVPPVCSGDSRWIAGGELGRVVARVPFEEPQDERLANARLIAAAPELLAALEFIINDAEPGEDARLTVDGYNRACAAIAKAKGAP